MEAKNTLQEISKKKELVRHYAEYTMLRGKIGLMAFHGGLIENGTEEMANYICQKTYCSLYVFSGRLSRSNYERLHVPSSMLDPAHSEKLSSFMSHIQAAIAFHGHRIDECILVGGLNVQLRKMIVEGLSGFSVKDVVEDKDPSYNLVRGTSLSNIVNKSPKKGVQIEIPLHLREVRGGKMSEEAQKVGNAFADVLNALD